jgi:hypothetical protein
MFDFDICLFISFVFVILASTAVLVCTGASAVGKVIGKGQGRVPGSGGRSGMSPNPPSAFQ